MKAGRHLLSLINDLLDISSIEAGGSDLDLEPLPLAELIEGVQSLAAPLVNTAGLRFEPGLPAERLFAMGDRRRVVQVLLNLIANAAKYHGTGTAVRISCCQAGEMVRLEVADDGRGIAPKDVKRLFTPFDRLDQQKSGRTDGTGLGLALSRRLVQSMGGEIGFEPQSKGALFWFTLPLGLKDR